MSSKTGDTVGMYFQGNQEAVKVAAGTILEIITACCDEKTKRAALKALSNSACGETHTSISNCTVTMAQPTTGYGEGHTDDEDESDCDLEY